MRASRAESQAHGMRVVKAQACAAGAEPRQERVRATASDVVSGQLFWRDAPSSPPRPPWGGWSSRTRVALTTSGHPWTCLCHSCRSHSCHSHGCRSFASRPCHAARTPPCAWGCRSAHRCPRRTPAAQRHWQRSTDWPPRSARLASSWSCPSDEGMWMRGRTGGVPSCHGGTFHVGKTGTSTTSLDPPRAEVGDLVGRDEP